MKGLKGDANDNLMKNKGDMYDMKRILNFKKCIGIAMILAMIAGLVPAETTMAAKKVAISKKTVTLTAGKQTTL